MAGLLVFVQHDEGEFSPNSLGMLAKAASLGEATAFVAGSGVDDSWAAGLGAHGASKVVVADDAALGGGLSQPVVDAIEPLAREADAVLFGAGVVSADVAAGLAARLGAGIHCETTEIALADGGVVATRPALGSCRSGRRTAGLDDVEHRRSRQYTALRRSGAPVGQPV